MTQTIPPSKRAQSVQGAKRAKSPLRESREAALRHLGDLDPLLGLPKRPAARSGPQSLGAKRGAAKPSEAQGKAPRAEGAPSTDSNALVRLRFWGEDGTHLADVEIKLAEWERIKRMARKDKMPVREWLVRAMGRELEATDAS